MLRFHHFEITKPGATHIAASKPWDWFWGLKPILLHYQQVALPGCGSSRCIQEIRLLGTPTIWWMSIPILLWALWRIYRHHDRCYSVATFSLLAGWLPWLVYSYRTMFLYYVVSLTPFLCILLALACGDILYGPAQLTNVITHSTMDSVPSYVSVRQRLSAMLVPWEKIQRMYAVCCRRIASLEKDTVHIRISIVVFYLILVVMNFLWKYPIFTGIPLTQHVHDLELWFPSWRVPRQEDQFLQNTWQHLSSPLN